MRQVTGGALVVAGVWLSSRGQTLTPTAAPPGREADELQNDPRHELEKYVKSRMFPDLPLN